jgi:hypothetical protein
MYAWEPVLKVYYPDAGTKGGIEVVASDGDVLELAGAAGCLFPTPKLQPGALAAPVG